MGFKKGNKMWMRCKNRKIFTERIIGSDQVLGYLCGVIASDGCLVGEFTGNIRELTDLTGIVSFGLVRSRMRNGGWSAKKALLTPVKEKYKREKT